MIASVKKVVQKNLHVSGIIVAFRGWLTPQKLERFMNKAVSQKDGDLQNKIFWICNC